MLGWAAGILEFAVESALQMRGGQAKRERPLPRTQERAWGYPSPPKAQPTPGIAQAKGLRYRDRTLWKAGGIATAPTGSRVVCNPNLSGPKTEGGQHGRPCLPGTDWGDFLWPQHR